MLRIWSWCIFITFCRIEKKKQLYFWHNSSNWHLVIYQHLQIGRFWCLSLLRWAWSAQFDTLLEFYAYLQITRWRENVKKISRSPTLWTLISALLDFVPVMLAIRQWNQMLRTMPLLLDNLHQLINQLRHFINYSYDVLVGECFCKGWVFCFFNIVFGLLHCHGVVQFFVINKSAPHFAVLRFFIITWSITD